MPNAVGSKMPEHPTDDAMLTSEQDFWQALHSTAAGVATSPAPQTAPEPQPQAPPSPPAAAPEPKEADTAAPQAPQSPNPDEAPVAADPGLASRLLHSLSATLAPPGSRPPGG